MGQGVDGLLLPLGHISLPPLIRLPAPFRPQQSHGTKRQTDRCPERGLAWTLLQGHGLSSVMFAKQDIEKPWWDFPDQIPGFYDC